MRTTIHSLFPQLSFFTLALPAFAPGRWLDQSLRFRGGYGPQTASHLPQPIVASRGNPFSNPLSPGCGTRMLDGCSLNPPSLILTLILILILILILSQYQTSSQVLAFIPLSLYPLISPTPADGPLAHSFSAAAGRQELFQNHLHCPHASHQHQPHPRPPTQTQVPGSTFYAPVTVHTLLRSGESLMHFPNPRHGRGAP